MGNTAEDVLQEVIRSICIRYTNVFDLVVLT